MAKIKFELFAPYNASVSLLGEFNQWEPMAMEKGEDGVFSIDVDLEDGRYQYRFEVASQSWFYDEDQLVQVCDPYATEVADEEDQNAVLILKGGKRVTGNYEWKNDAEPLPQTHQIIIYEVLPHDYTGDPADAENRGGFKKIQEKLGYMTDLGINALELMPIEEYPGSNGWGYNPRHLFAVESSYGSPDDLKALIDACHGEGIRVFKDGVYNHAETSTPLAQIDHDYWFHHDPKDADLNWGPEFNYDKHDETFDLMPARKFVGDVIGHWISEYHIDGIRFDAVAQLNNFDIVRWLGEKGHEIAGESPFAVIAEFMPDDPKIVKPDGPADACWNETFYNTMSDVLTGKTVEVDRILDCIDPRRRGYPDSHSVVNYLTNHDHDRLMTVLGNADIFDESAFKRCALGAVILMTAVGIPMIWAGEEFGAAGGETNEPAPLDWSLLDNEPNQRLHSLYKGLIHLRRENSALHGGDIDFFLVDEDLPLVAYTHWNGEGSRVVVVANFSDTFLSGYSVKKMPTDGVYKDWIYGGDVTCENGELLTDLGEWEAKVFVI